MISGHRLLARCRSDGIAVKPIRHCLSTLVMSTIRSLKAGDTLHPSDLGHARFPPSIRSVLSGHGLSICGITRKVYTLEQMRSRWYSHEGRLAEGLYHGARKRATKKGLWFDAELMKQMLYWSTKPTHFNGVPYLPPIMRRHTGPHRMSLSVDQIVVGRGYGRGNVRFLPHWLNQSLQCFSDMKAYRIAERLAGYRPTLLAQPIMSKHYPRAKRSIRFLRYNAGDRGIFVHSDLTFERLLQSGFFVERCPFSGIRLSYDVSTKGGGSDSPSVDRIDPSGGYAASNVQMVAQAVNGLKSNFQICQLPELLIAIEHLRTHVFRESHVPVCVR